MEGDIPKEYFVKFMNKLEDEKKLLLEEIEKREQSLSNLTEYIDFAIEISSMLSDLWDCSNYEDKQLLQKTIFPDKIFYDKKNHQYRTSEINTALKVIRSITEKKEGQKKGRTGEKTNSSGLVERSLELSNLFLADFTRICDLGKISVVKSRLKTEKKGLIKIIYKE